MNSSSSLKEKSPGHTDRYKNNPTDNAWSIKNAAYHTFSKNTRPQNKLKKNKLFYCDIYDIEPLLIWMTMGTLDMLQYVMV